MRIPVNRGEASRRGGGMAGRGTMRRVAPRHVPKRGCDTPPASLETIAAFDRYLPTDDHCLEQLFQARFGAGFDCLRCRRATNWHRIKAERAYSCQWCGNHLHPTVGTPLQNSRIPLRLWFYAIRQPNGISAQLLVEQIVTAFGVAPATAQRVVRRVRDKSIDWAEIILASQRWERRAQTPYLSHWTGGAHQTGGIAVSVTWQDAFTGSAVGHQSPSD